MNFNFTCKFLILLFFQCLITNIIFSQIPTIKAIGGDGRNINWSQIKKEQEADAEGPGFFYNDCAQGVLAISASSTLGNQGSNSYKINNISDDNPMTAWVEGKANYGFGEYFEIKASAINVIYNGYQSSQQSWINNSRVKKLKVYKNNVPICFLILTDEMGRQIFELPGNENYNPDKKYIFRFEIVEVYPGLKWSDVAISEINYWGCCLSGETIIYSDQKNKINNTKVDDFIWNIDINTGFLSKTKVKKIVVQEHLGLYRVSCSGKDLDVTYNHPLYIKGIGFCSLGKYMSLRGLHNISDLINKIEILMYDDITGKLHYEKIDNINYLEGNIKTYTIVNTGNINSYIANGFVTQSY